MALDQNEPYELRVDKFTFRFPKSLRYSDVGLWIRQEGVLLRLGLSDFAQQRSGDVAFASIASVGTELDKGDEIASIETVKVNISLPSPVRGTVVDTNPALREAPELINQDPYGKGWIAVLQPKDTELPLTGLFDAQGYLDLAKQQAEMELKS